MSSKVIFSVLSSLLAVQSACGHWLPSPGCGAAPAPAPACAAGPAFSPPSGGDVWVCVASGSPLSPGGISISGQNELAGSVDVTGSAPFATAVSLSGAVPSSGHASVQYSTAPGAGLTAGGCGRGVAQLPAEWPQPGYPAWPQPGYPSVYYAPGPSCPCACA